MLEARITIELSDPKFWLQIRKQYPPNQISDAHLVSCRYSDAPKVSFRCQILRCSPGVRQEFSICMLTWCPSDIRYSYVHLVSVRYQAVVCSPGVLQVLEDPWDEGGAHEALTNVV